MTFSNIAQAYVHFHGDKDEYNRIASSTPMDSLVIKSSFRYYLSRVIQKGKIKDSTPPPKKRKTITPMEPDHNYLHFGNIAQIYDCRTGTTGFYSQMAEANPMRKQIIDSSFFYYRGRVIRKMLKRK